MIAKEALFDSCKGVRGLRLCCLSAMHALAYQQRCHDLFPWKCACPSTLPAQLPQHQTTLSHSQGRPPGPLSQVPTGHLKAHYKTFSDKIDHHREPRRHLPNSLPASHPPLQSAPRFRTEKEESKRGNNSVFFSGLQCALVRIGRSGRRRSQAKKALLERARSRSICIHTWEMGRCGGLNSLS